MLRAQMGDGPPDEAYRLGAGLALVQAVELALGPGLAVTSPGFAERQTRWDRLADSPLAAS